VKENGDYEFKTTQQNISDVHTRTATGTYVKKLSGNNYTQPDNLGESSMIMGWIG